MTLIIHGSPDQRQAFKAKFYNVMGDVSWTDNEAVWASSTTFQDAPTDGAMAEAFLNAMKGLCGQMADATGVSLEWL